MKVILESVKSPEDEEATRRAASLGFDLEFDTNEMASSIIVSYRGVEIFDVGKFYFEDRSKRAATVFGPVSASVGLEVVEVLEKQMLKAKMLQRLLDGLLDFGLEPRVVRNTLRYSSHEEEDASYVRMSTSIRVYKGSALEAEYPWTPRGVAETVASIRASVERGS